MNSWGRLGIAAVVLAGLLGFLYWPKKAPAAAAVAPPLVKLNSADVQRIQIEPASGPQVVLSRDGGQWRLEQPYAAPADPAAVDGVVNTLGDITGVEDVGAGANPASFGFAQLAQVVLTTKTGAYDFQFGGDSPTGGNSYMRLGANGAIKIVPSYIKQDSLTNAFGLQDKTILPFSEDKLTGLQLVDHGRRVELARTNGNWPGDQQQNVQSMLDAVHDGEMTSMADPTGKQAGADGLAPADIRLSLAWPGGTAQLLVGKKKDPTEYYAQASGSPAIFTISDSLVTDIDAVANPPKQPTVVGPAKPAIPKQ